MSTDGRRDTTHEPSNGATPEILDSEKRAELLDRYCTIERVLDALADKLGPSDDDLAEIESTLFEYISGVVDVCEGPQNWTENDWHTYQSVIHQ